MVQWTLNIVHHLHNHQWLSFDTDDYFPLCAEGLDWGRRRSWRRPCAPFRKPLHSGPRRKTRATDQFLQAAETVAAPADTDTGLSFTVSLICYREENVAVDTGFKSLHFFTVKWQKIYLTGWRSLIVFGSQGNKHFTTWRGAERKLEWTLGEGGIAPALC